MPDSPEEGIAQNHIVNPRHLRIIHDISINEEENRQIHLFPCPNLLLLKAEAFYFSEIWRDLSPPISSFQA